MKRKLTVKQQWFVDLYDGNATDTAQKAGYQSNDATLRSVGAENLTFSMTKLKRLHLPNDFDKKIRGK